MSSSSSSSIILRVKCRSAKRCTEQNSDKTEKIRPPSFKNLVDFLSLSFDSDDSEKLLLLKLGRRASFTSFDLLFASSYFVVVVVVVVVCVLSLFLSKMMMMRAKKVEDERRGRVVYDARHTGERKRKERKRGRNKISLARKILGKICYFFFLSELLQFFFFLSLARTETSSREKERESQKDHGSRRVHSLSLSRATTFTEDRRSENTFKNTNKHRRERKKRIIT